MLPRNRLIGSDLSQAQWFGAASRSAAHKYDHQDDGGKAQKIEKLQRAVSAVRSNAEKPFEEVHIILPL